MTSSDKPGDALEPEPEIGVGDLSELPIGLSADPVVPPPGLKSKVMRQIESASTPEGVSVVPAEAPWKPHAVPMNRFKILSTDLETGAVTMLLKTEPGGRFPAHRHQGAEQCLVLEGSFYIGDRFYRKGDFIHASAGTADEEIFSPEGSTVLLIVSAEDAAAY